MAANGVWQAGSVLEVYSKTEARWLVALVTQVSKGQLTAWVADPRGTLGPKALAFEGLQLAALGTNVVELPHGCEMVPSRSRPGKVAYLDHVEKRKYQSRELAWRCHIERNVDLTAGMLSSTQQAAPAFSSGTFAPPPSIYASPPDQGDDEEPAATSLPPRLPVAQPQEALPVKVKQEHPPAQVRNSSLRSASELPREAAPPPPPPPEHPPRAERPRGEEAFAQPAPPRCGGAFCGAFCPLRMKKLHARMAGGLEQADIENIWVRRQRRRKDPENTAEPPVAVAVPAPPPRPAAATASSLKESPQPCATERYADQVATALARAGAAGGNRRTPLYHFPALVSMGFSPAAARSALETTGGDLVRAVEICAAGEGGGTAAPAVETPEPSQAVSCTQEPALPFARQPSSLRRGNSEASFEWPDSAEDRLRAAEEAAAFADELHEEAVEAAISLCEKEQQAHSERPRGGGAFEEALAAAYERYNETALEEEHKPRVPGALGFPGATPGTPLAAASQTQPDESHGSCRSGSPGGAGRAGRPGSAVEFFDGPPRLPCAASQATQPEEPFRQTMALQRGGRRAGSPPRGRSGRPRAARGQKGASQEFAEKVHFRAEKVQLKEELEPKASVKEEEDEDLFGDRSQQSCMEIAEQTPGSQLESMLAAAIDVPDDLDMEVPATDPGKREILLAAAAPTPVSQCWDEVAEPGASPLLPWGFASPLPRGELGTQAGEEVMATAWEPSAMY